MCIYSQSEYNCLKKGMLSIVTLKRLGRLPNERGRGGGAISACSEVIRLMFSVSKYLVIRWTFCKKKSILPSTSWIRVHPKTGLFQADFFCFDYKFSFWINILGLYINFFPPKLLDLRSLSEWKVMLFGQVLPFLHFFEAASRQSGMTFFEPKPLQKASFRHFRKNQNFQDRSVGRDLEIKAPPSLFGVKKKSK